jgi:hypothetical protein
VGNTQLLKLNNQNVSLILQYLFTWLILLFFFCPPNVAAALYQGSFGFGFQRSSCPKAFIVSVTQKNQWNFITAHDHILSISQSYYSSSYITYAFDKCH